MYSGVHGLGLGKPYIWVYDEMFKWVREDL